MLKMLFNF